jgi:hypothetical protein
LRRTMDCRVKPGNDEVNESNRNSFWKEPP